MGSSNRYAPGCDCCGNCEDIKVTVTCRCTGGGELAEGVEVQLLDRYDNVVDEGTTDEDGICVLEPTHADQYWVRVIQGCDSPNPDTDIEVNVLCGKTCRSSVPCDACAGYAFADLGTVLDDHGLHALHYDPSALAFVTDILSAESDSAYNRTYLGFGWDCQSWPTVPYQYRVTCENGKLRCRLFTPALSPCQGSNPICGYFAAEDGTDRVPDFASFDVSSTPTIADEMATAEFDFEPALCGTTPVAAPSLTANVTLPVNADEPAVTCASPCPLPLADLKLAYTDDEGNEVGFDLVRQNTTHWAATCKALTVGPYASGKATLSCTTGTQAIVSLYASPGCLGPAVIVNPSAPSSGWRLTRYICEPLEITWKNGTSIMKLREG